MDRVIYFIEKLWTFFITIHPLTYLILIILTGFLFVMSKWTIQKLRPQTIKQNTVAVTLTIFVGLPVVLLILYFIFGLYLKNQPF